MENKEKIIKSRSGGFGGSDAKMFLKVGMNGIKSLSDTDLYRIAVAMGQAEYKDTPTTPAMQRGNEFEAWIAENVLTGFENNKRIEAPVQPKNFEIFMHADFSRVHHNVLDGVETKYTSANGDETIVDYHAQLQWYYYCGFHHVRLLKGTQGEPFNVFDEYLIEKDENTLDFLQKGINLIDDFVEGWQYEAKEELDAVLLLPHERKEVERMYSIITQIETLKQQEEALKEKMLEFMENNSIKSIKSDLYSITYVPAGISNRFDKAALLKDHPEINETDYTKQTKRKAYVTMKVKK